MTTRTMPDLHETRCRDLAEICSCGYLGADHVDLREYKPDPRFASLQGEHEGFDGVTCHDCGARWAPGVGMTTYCLRTDLGAIVTSFKASGFDFEIGPGYVAINVYGDIIRKIRERWDDRPCEEAASAALWQAVFG